MRVKKITAQNNILYRDYIKFITNIKEQSIEMMDSNDFCNCIRRLILEDMVVVTDKFHNEESVNDFEIYLTQYRQNSEPFYNYQGNDYPYYVYDYYKIDTCPVCGAKIEAKKSPVLQKKI